ncbi:hypothetical protein [Shimia aestuarii]|uniref:hypothetical protein n=1 Tax=Shimia aestuarii TaxID=254406 RepID=UPI001FB1FF00|nr:hypothetical protein [Shimia aestuarii]
MVSVSTAPHSNRAREIALAVHKFRLRDCTTGEFLHLSGQGRTRDIKLSWLGFSHQAQTLRDRALARGEPWPFTPIRRSLFEIDRASQVME